MAKTKKVLDIVLLLLFFAELAGMFLPNSVHEILGLVFFVLIVVHNVLNRQFYRSLLRGPYPPRRLLNIVCIFLFFLSLLVLAVSGIALSQTLFPSVQLASGISWQFLHFNAALCALVLLFVHLLIHARRYIRGRRFYVIAVLAFLLAAGGIVGLPYIDRWYHPVNVNAPKIIDGEKVSLPGKTLTIYFSRVGNTNFPANVDSSSGASVMKNDGKIMGNNQLLALMVQNATASDLAILQVTEPYPTDYRATTTVAQTERQNGIYRPLKNTLPDLGQYQNIVLIYPLWWGTLPMPVEEFLQQHDLSGKTLIPIVSHGGSGAGDSLADIQKNTKADVKEPLAIYSSNIPTSRQAIADYLKTVR